MILCLDSGNTRLKWGLGELIAGVPIWQAQGVLLQSQVADLRKALQHLPVAERVVGSNVAGDVVAAGISAALDAPVSWLRATACSAGVRNAYAAPQKLGIDRWAALVAARQLCEGNTLVVSAGTATTIDMLSGEGVFQGGVIIPGVSLMLQSLARSTAQLPLAEAEYQSWPRDTHAAIASGVLEAQVGAIERLFARASACKCYLTGGAATVIAPLLNVPHVQIDDLALQGVMHLAQAL